MLASGLRRWRHWLLTTLCLQNSCGRQATCFLLRQTDVRFTKDFLTNSGILFSTFRHVLVCLWSGPDGSVFSGPLWQDVCAAAAQAVLGRGSCPGPSSCSPDEIYIPAQVWGGRPQTCLASVTAATWYFLVRGCWRSMWAVSIGDWVQGSVGGGGEERQRTGVVRFENGCKCQNRTEQVGGCKSSFALLHYSPVQEWTLMTHRQ